jgi:hypothetical protein
LILKDQHVQLTGTTAPVFVRWIRLHVNGLAHPQPEVDANPNILPQNPGY